MTSSASMARIVPDISPDDGSSIDDPFDDVRSMSSHFTTRGPTLTSSVTAPSLSTLKSIKPSRQPILESSKESLMAEEINGKTLFRQFFSGLHIFRIKSKTFFCEINKKDFLVFSSSFKMFKTLFELLYFLLSIVAAYVSVEIICSNRVLLFFNFLISTFKKSFLFFTTE